MDMFGQKSEELKRARGSFRGAKPLLPILPPSPLKERGIQGVR